ncbi:MAG: hypothetical protein LBR79_05920 [Oscillospiraceae bacterium]|jgi:hypothetical protein|nr:hypothetical protein [Oscillospiraceae bacterium]
MSFLKILLNLFVLLGFSLLIISAKWPKPSAQVQVDMRDTENKIMRITNSNAVSAKEFCEKIISDQDKLHVKYDEVLKELAIPAYCNQNFLREQRLWAECYDIMGLPGFSDLIETLNKHDVDYISYANAYLYLLYDELLSHF